MVGTRKVIGRRNDKRYKITPEERDDIIMKHREGASVISLADMYDVTRNCIYMIVDPERRAEHNKAARLFSRRKPSNPERSRAYDLKHRMRLQTIGVVVDTDTE